MNEYTLEQRQQLRRLPYDKYLRTDFWFYVRRLALEQTKYRCSVCHSKHNPEVHHLSYEHRGFEDCNLRDLVTLCRQCHAKEHSKPAYSSTDDKKPIGPHFGGGDVTRCRPMTENELDLFRQYRASVGRKVPDPVECTEEQLRAFNLYWRTKEEQQRH